MIALNAAFAILKAGDSSRRSQMAEAALQQILIITLAPSSLSPLGQALERQGFGVALHSPEEMSSSWAAAGVDAVVIDLTADWSQETVRRLLRDVKGNDEVATIALLRPDQLPQYDVTEGLSDFQLVPADPLELGSRLRQALWRVARIDNQNLLKHGDLVIDLASYRVFVAGHPLSLTYKEYELLRFLVTNHGKVFSREALLNRVWGYDFYGGARTVDVHIRRLRSKIEAHGHTFVETVRNVGYRFRASSSP